ncbi:TolC family outer membrane protein [Oceanibaculum nanhaiense]|uniref:TolC family outer membrane protein n=1 Tax=Oceanibaculum nanhaiense TaxID=1909734 RepID=UPI00396EDF84
MDQAENTIRRQRALLTDTEQQVLLQAGSIFMDVIRDSRTLALTRNNIAVLEERRRTTRALYDVGDATQADLSQAEARLAQARAQRIAAQGQLDASRATYAQIVGQPPEEPQMPGPVSGLPETLEAALSLAERWNPALGASGIAERIARDQIRIRRGEMLPSVALVGRIQEESYDDPLPLDRQSQASLGVQLTVPLYQSGADHARLREAKKRANQRQLETVSQMRKVQEQVIRAWRDLQTARASVAALDEQIAAARQAQDSVRREVEIGRRPLLDLLDAQQELLDAEVNRTGQQRDVVVGELTLLSTIGALTAESLGLPTDLHDPLADYEATKWRLFGTEVQ